MRTPATAGAGIRRIIRKECRRFVRTENHGLRFFGKWDEDYTDNYLLTIG